MTINTRNDSDVEVANFPAYKIIRRRNNAFWDQAAQAVTCYPTALQANDRLALKFKDYYRTYMISSVVSYALKNNDDPIEAYNRAVTNKHDTHFIIALASVISSPPPPQETLTLVEYGMIIKFEGKLFTIEKAHNDNLSLKPYKPAAV